MAEVSCSRCGRVTLKEDTLEWEVDQDERWICPGCLTPADIQATDAEFMALDTPSCIRCGRQFDEASHDVANWLEVWSGWICAQCVTPLDLTRRAAQETPHRVSAERIAAGANALQQFANTYIDTLEADVSPDERRRLHEAAELVDRALGWFDR